MRAGREDGVAGWRQGYTPWGTRQHTDPGLVGARQVLQLLQRGTARRWAPCVLAIKHRLAPRLQSCFPGPNWT